MSGPKYSEAELEQARLEIIRRQLEIEMENAKCNELRNSISALDSKTEGVLANIDFEKMDKIIKDADSQMSNKSLINELRNKIAEVKKESSIKPTVSGDSTKLAEIEKSFNKRLSAISKASREIQDMVANLNVEYNEAFSTNKEEAFSNKEWNSIETFSNVSSTLLEKYNEVLSEAEGMPNYNNEVNACKAIMDNHSFDDAYKIAQLEMRLQALNVEKNMTVMVDEATISEYKALCMLLYGEYKNIPKDASEVSNQISEMKKLLEEKKCGEYVAEAIRNVMTELGYDISSSEILAEQQMQKQFFDYSPNSAVTIATSDSGAVMLEVVGTNSEASKTAVRMDMERFCPDYERVKEGLKEYGIILNDKKLCPPDEKYVRYVDAPKHDERRAGTKKKYMRIDDE